MIFKICNNLYTGSAKGLIFTNKTEWFIVGASQIFHYYRLGWKLGYPDKASLHYLIHEQSNYLTLNWVDGDKRLFLWYDEQKFKQILDIIENKYKTKKVFIHCDLGESRGPSLTLLFLAKRLGIISNASFEDAKGDFLKLYPQYKPAGIGDYLADLWYKII
jgi:hypothetical protein